MQEFLFPLQVVLWYHLKSMAEISHSAIVKL